MWCRPESKHGEGCVGVGQGERFGLLDDEVPIEGGGVFEVADGVGERDTDAVVEIEVSCARGFGAGDCDANGATVVGGADDAGAEDWIGC